jgi:hypothetical protein
VSPRSQKDCPVVRKDQLICEDVSEECVIYDSRQKRAHHLNSTLTWIWRRCDGNTSIDSLAADCERQFNITNGFHVVLTGLEQLDARDLLEHPIDITGVMAAETTAVSRRAVVATGSVLMPLVVSILAPTPAAAKSKDKDKEKDKK